MRRLLIAAAVGTLMGSSPPAAGQQETRAHEYERISREAFLRGASVAGTQLPPRERLDRARADLYRLAQETIGEVLSAPGATSRTVRSAIEELQGEASLGARLPETRLPFADLAGIHGIPTLVVAFAVLTGGEGVPDVQAHIQFHSRASNEWTLVADVGQEFNGRGFSMSAMRSPLLNERWYLAWGTILGNNRGRLRMRLYGFDGVMTRTAWERDIERAQLVSATEDRVELRYTENFDPPFLGPLREVIEILQPSPSEGLTVVEMRVQP